MASDPKTSKVGGGGATDPQSLMNVDRHFFFFFQSGPDYKGLGT